MELLHFYVMNAITLPSVWGKSMMSSSLGGTRWLQSLVSAKTLLKSPDITPTRSSLVLKFVNTVTYNYQVSNDIAS